MKDSETYHILVVDDEFPMRQMLRIYLQHAGYRVTEASGGTEALALWDKQSYDLLILDLMMPETDGWTVCETVRASSAVPILMLTARAGLEDRVEGLQLGADDYLAKPFEAKELVARVHALLRRSYDFPLSPEPSQEIQRGRLRMNPDKRSVSISEEEVVLTPKEFDLLHTLVVKPGRVFSRELLLQQIWGMDYMGDVRTVDTHMKNLRWKLTPFYQAKNPIHTVWGVGYKGV
jgi:two-component system response regulator ResD